MTCACSRRTASHVPTCVPPSAGDTVSSGSQPFPLSPFPQGLMTQRQLEGQKWCMFCCGTPWAPVHTGTYGLVALADVQNS